MKYASDICMKMNWRISRVSGFSSVLVEISQRQSIKKNSPSSIAIREQYLTYFPKLIFMESTEGFVRLHLCIFLKCPRECVDGEIHSPLPR